MTWHAAISAYMTYLAAGGSPASTRTTRRQQLHLVANALGGTPWKVRPDVLLSWFGSLDVAVETRRSRRTTLRGFYRWAQAEGYVADNVALVLPVVKPARPRPKPTPVPVYETALMDEKRADVRLMLRLARECGLRRAEVATGHSERLMEDLAGWSLLVMGKGGRQRVVPLPDSLARDLLALPSGWFFPGQMDGHLSPRWVGRLVRDALPGVWTMHSLRHRAATDWHEIDHDLPSVQELLGHASIETTRAYVATSDDKLRRLVATAAA